MLNFEFIQNPIFRLQYFFSTKLYVFLNTLCIQNLSFKIQHYNNES